MRPRYCTQQDRENEARVLARFVKRLAETAPAHTWAGKATPDDMDVDGVIYRDGVACCLIEIKNRKGSGAGHDTWFIAEDKITRCQRRAAALKLNFVLLMVWESEIFYIANKDIPMTDVRQGGRTDRKDPHDIERMLHIPQTLFRKYSI